MRLFSDWKFVVTLVVAIAGVVVPVWLWQADLSSKSLSVAVINRVSLQPQESESLPGMEISVDGSRLLNPYLVVFEVTNDGSKPILPNDFESPLDIRLDSDTQFVRYRITRKAPKDIDTDISGDKKRISLKPALLNPKDSISISVITTGVAPTFETKARVVGIPDISITDTTTNKPTTARLISLLIASVLLSIVSMVAYGGATDSKGVLLRQRAAAFVSFVSAFPSVLAFMTFLEDIGVSSFWYFLLYYLLLMIPVSFLAAALNRKPNGTEQAPSGK